MALRSPLTGVREYRTALRERFYRRLWSASLISRAGDAINFAALPLFVYSATGSPAAVALLVLAEGCGLIVGGVAAQLTVDRYPPRRLLITLDGVRACLMLALVVSPSYGMALGVGLTLAIATGCASPLLSALVPRLVTDESLAAANALQWTAAVIPQLVGAPLGGLLIAFSTARIAFAINAASFAISAVILLGLPVLKPGMGVGGPWQQLRGALEAVRGVPVLRPLLAMQALAAISVGGTSALLVVLAERDYGVGAAGYGLWLMAIALGALLGPLIVPVLPRASSRTTVAAAYVVRGAGDVGCGLLDQGLAGGLLLGLYGVSTSSGMVAYQTMVQRSVPESLRGRAFALLDVVWQVGRLTSIAGAGLLAVRFGARPVFIGGGLLLVAAGLVGARGLARAAE